MQKKINYLAIHYPYEYIEIGLYQDSMCLAQTQEHKFKASMMLIPMIDAVLKNSNMKLSDIDYIAVNIGPAPYNTLRALIATANAIAFAKNIPLIGCNALELLKDFYTHNEYETVALLQAFAGHVYFKHNTTEIYCTIEEVIAKLNPNKKYYFVGNGITKYKEQLEAAFADSFYNSQISFPELSTCAQQSLQFFKENKTKSELHPVYLHQSLH